MIEYIKIGLQADPIGLVRGFAEADTAIKKFQATYNAAAAMVTTGAGVFSKLNDQVKTFGKASLAAGASLSTSYAASIKLAMDFQTQLKNVQSLTKATAAEMGQTQEEIFGMSQRLPQSPVELAAATYDIASSGFEGAEATKVLEASAIGASAGLSSAAVASKAIVAALNAYGLEASEAADISDILFQAVNVGVLTFEQMAGAMGQWVGMAAQVGVAADEGAAAIATMTLAGISADEAATYLSRLMEAFVQPSEAMSAAVQKAGYASAKAMLDAEGLGGSLFKVQEATEGDATAFMELFPSIQAARGAMAILSADGKNWERTSSAIMDKTARAGAAMETYAVQSESFSVKWTKMWNSIKTIAIQMGSVFLRPLGFVVSMVSGILQAFLALPSPIKTTIALLGGAAAVVLTLGGLFITLASSVLISKLALFALAKGFTFLETATGSIGMVSGAFGRMATFIAAQGGIFKALTAGVRHFISAMRIAIGMGGGLGGVLRGLAFGPIGKGLGFAAITMAAFTLTQGLKDAADEGKRMGESFKASLKTDTFFGMLSGLKDLNSELDKTRSELADLGAGPTGALSLGNELGMLNPFDGEATEKIITEKQAYFAELESAKTELQTRMTDFQAVATAIFLKQQNIGLTTGPTRKQKEVTVPIDEKKIQELEERHIMVMVNEIDKTMTYRDEITPVMITGPLKNAFRAIPEGMEGSLNDAEKLVKKFDPINVFAKSDAATRRGMAEYGKNLSGRALFDLNHMMVDVQRLAEAKSISIDEIIKPGSKAAQDIAEAYVEFRTLAPAAQEAALAFFDMGDASESASSNVEKLNEALHKTLDASLGLEAARDGFQGMVNDLYKSVQEMKEAGTLQEAMQLDSFHEDALTLRGQWRDLVGGMVDETTAFAESQEGITGADIDRYLEGQIAQLKRYGDELGLSDEFVNNYIASLLRLTEQDVINVQFDDNLGEQQARLDSYLLEVLKTPENVNTYMFLSATEAEEDLRKWMHEMGVQDDRVINQTIQLRAEQAYSELKNYVDTLGVADSLNFINGVIQLSAQYDENSKEVKEFLSKSGVTPEKYQIAVDMLGAPESVTHMGILKMLSEDLDGKTSETTVRVIDEATGKIGQITEMLAALPKVKPVTIKVTEEKETKEEKPKGGGEERAPSAPAGEGRRRITSADGNVIKFFARGGMLKRYFASGTENHVAQIAPAGAMRVWAEPETGGEAYIPLAPAKRERSMSILQQVAGDFGMKVVPQAIGSILRFAPDQRIMNFAQGGVTKVTSYATGGANDPLGTRFRPPSKEEQEREAKKKKDEAESAKREVEKAEQDRVDRVQQTIEISEFKLEMMGGTPEQYIQVYKQFVGQFKPYSDEWMELQRKIKDAQDKMKENQIAWVDSIIGLGHVSLVKQVDILQKRAENEATFSTKWFEIAREFVERRDELMKRQFDAGVIGKDQYLAFLQERLRGVELYSDDWFDLTEKIKNINEESRQEELKRQKEMNEVGDISDSAYLDFLRQRLANTEKFKDDYMEIWNEIQGLEQDALRKSANIFDKFNNRMNVSSQSIIGWLKKQVKQAKAFREAMDKLAQSGQYSSALLSQVEDMGPAGLGLARGLLQGVGTPQGQEIVSLLGEAQTLGIQTASYDRGGYLMPGLTLAYNGTGAPERVGNQETVVVQGGPALNVEHMTVADTVDVDMISKKTAFAVRTRRL